MTKRKRRIILGVLFITWIAVAVLWQDDALRAMKPEVEEIKQTDEAPMMSFKSYGTQIEEAPIKESKAQSPIMNLQNIITGLIALINAVFGSILLIQKVIGKR